MTPLSRVVTTALPLLILSGLALGARSAVRELVAPLAGLEGIGRTSRVQPVAPEPEPESSNGDVDRADLTLKSESMAFASSGSSAVTPEAIKAQFEELKAQLDELVASQGTLNHGVIKGFERFFLNEDQRRKRAEWDQWKSQAIAALPADLRDDSDYRRAIDDNYRRATGECLDQFAADIISRPPIGGYDLGGIGFTDIDDQITAKDHWVTLWDEWRAREVASLPEALRNDPNRLSVIDTTYNEMVKLHGRNSTLQLMYFMDIGLEVEVNAVRQVSEKSIRAEVDR